MIINGCMPKVETTKSINYLKLSYINVSAFEDPLFDTVKIKNVSGIDHIFTRDFVYCIDGGFYNRYAFHKWYDPVANQVEAILFIALKNSNLFKNVLSKDSKARFDYLLEPEIFAFEQTIAGDTSFIKVEININLIDTATDKVIASNLFSSKITTIEKNAESTLIAYNDAMFQIISELLLWIKGISKNGNNI
jgi:ABC-type uncharacterized transport system auxiliary subunit